MYRLHYYRFILYLLHLFSFLYEGVIPVVIIQCIFLLKHTSFCIAEPSSVRGGDHHW